MFLFSLTGATILTFIDSWIYSPAPIFIFMQLTFIADFIIASRFALKNKVWDSDKAPNTIDKMIWNGFLISMLYWLQTLFSEHTPLLSSALFYLSAMAALQISSVQIISFVATGAREGMFSGKFAEWLNNTIDTKKLSTKQLFEQRQKEKKD